MAPLHQGCASTGLLKLTLLLLGALQVISRSSSPSWAFVPPPPPRRKGAARRPAAPAHAAPPLAAAAAAEGVGPLIDVRSGAAFAAGHATGATHLPLDELEERTFELPAPFETEAPLRLCGGNTGELSAARALLEAKGWAVCGPDSPHARVWPASEEEDGQAGVVPAGGGFPGIATTSYGLDSSVPCWRPSAFLADVVARDLLAPGSDWARQWGAAAAPALPGGTRGTRDGGAETARGGAEAAAAAAAVGAGAAGAGAGALGAGCVAVDLGCGSGRDAVYLALALPPHFTVVGIDNHRAALERAAALAARSGLPKHRCVFIHADLRKLKTPEALADVWRRDGGGGGGGGGGIRAGPGLCGPVGLVHGCRFLDRGLLRLVRDSDAVLAPGGAVVWSTFMEGDANLAPPYRPSRRLFSGEMKHLFSEEKEEEAVAKAGTAKAGAKAGRGGEEKEEEEEEEEGKEDEVGGGVFRVLRDEVGHLNTRRTDVPASFFAAVRRPPSVA